MTYRRWPIVPQQIYHVYNRSIARQPIFLEKGDCLRFINGINFYRFSSDLRFSFFNRMTAKEKSDYLSNVQIEENRRVTIFTFNLMPNHYHFQLMAKEEGGIKQFISNLQNSYAKYFNSKFKRTGSLFQEMFKATLIENDDQFLHVSRYIHLNPYSSNLVKNFDQLENYEWSSLPGYLGNGSFNFIDEKFLNSFYKSQSDIKRFTLDQADYQRKLEEIKHLIFE